jgi:hypothetical protein
MFSSLFNPLQAKYLGFKFAPAPVSDENDKDQGTIILCPSPDKAGTHNSKQDLHIRLFF